MKVLARGAFLTATSEISATQIPATTSRRKWLAVARTQNQTQAGQSAQTAFFHQWRESATRKTPTMSASAAWRLGMAAYGFARAASAPFEWLTPSWKYVVNIHGGAVGHKT